MKDLSILPGNLPVPEDDGACDHLKGMRVPSASLGSASGTTVDISACDGVVVIYCYPMIGRPDSPPLVGWNDIPGARGCTPQSCAFRDHYAELAYTGARVYGVSAQPLADQAEARSRLELPFDLLNDSEFVLTEALRLPTFQYEGNRLIKRLTLVVADGVIKKVFYPVFPPDRNAEAVLEWLKQH
ncbi:MAG: peroxiredoxin [Gammaproteobacteria bacterium]|nr:peroxiredoxin [Gammaproteobacteria bacterium]